MIEKSTKIKTRFFLLGIAILIGFVFFVGAKFGDTKQFILLVQNIEIKWILLGLVLQVGTYICAGFIWYIAVDKFSNLLSIKTLARLSVEQLSVNQIIPSAGVAGNMLVFKSMIRLGLPAEIAMRAVFIDIFALLTSYWSVTFFVLVVLFFINNVVSFLIIFISIFLIFISILIFLFLLLLRSRNVHLPNWALRIGFISEMADAIYTMKSQTIPSRRILFQATVLRIFIFILDAGTLWVMLKSISFSVPVIVVFISMVVASISGIVSFLPGGLKPEL